MDFVATVIARQEWKAVEPKTKDILKLPVPVSTVAVTWTETETCTTKRDCTTILQKMQKEHMENDGSPDIKYNFLIGGDGEVYEGCGWEAATKVSSGHRGYYRELNAKSILVAYMGPRDMFVTEPMKICVYGIKNLGIAKKMLTADTKLVILHKGDPDDYKVDIVKEWWSPVPTKKSWETEIYQCVNYQGYRVLGYNKKP